MTAKVLTRHIDGDKGWAPKPALQPWPRHPI